MILASDSKIDKLLKSGTPKTKRDRSFPPNEFCLSKDTDPTLGTLIAGL